MTSISFFLMPPNLTNLKIKKIADKYFSIYWELQKNILIIPTTIYFIN